MKNQSTELVPSESKLKSLIGSQIKDIIRCSFETYEEHKEYLKECDIDGFDDRESFFKYAYGAILIVFEDVELSFVSAEDLNSLIVFLEKTDNEIVENYILKDSEVLEKISIHDIGGHSELINQEIVGIEILTRNDLNSRKQDLPSEVGIHFYLKNNRRFTLSHNLTENNFVFSILFENDRLPETLIVKEKYPKTD